MLRRPAPLGRLRRFDPRAHGRAKITSTWSPATGHVFALYRNLDKPTQAILRTWIEEMVRGMRQFVIDQPDGIRISSVGEFHKYCYYVAGTVGHLLTDLWHVHSHAIDDRTYARLVEDCEQFGRSAAVGQYSQRHRVGRRTRERDLHSVGFTGSGRQRS